MHKENIDLESLRYFVALVEEGNLSRAGLKIGISQPAISHALKKLRLIVGDPLVVRIEGKMTPTPKGEWLFFEAKKILAQVTGLKESNMLFNPEAYDGLFSISLPEYVDYRITSSLVAKIRQAAPEASVRIYPPNPPAAEKLLSSGELDIRLGWVDHIAGSMRSYVLYHENFVCLARKGHPQIVETLTRDLFSSIPQVRTQIVVPSTASRALDEAMALMGISTHVPLVVYNWMTVGRVVAESDMIACAPSGIAEHLAEIYGLVCHPIPLNIKAVKVAMYWHEKKHHSDRHVWLRNLVVGVVQTLGLLENIKTHIA